MNKCLNGKIKRLYYQKKNVIWEELVSDKALSLWAFESSGCHYTKKIKRKQSTDNDQAETDEKKQEQEEEKYDPDIPKDAVYENDWKILYGFEVRDGLERYGAAAYFDKEYMPCGVYVCHLQKTITPNDELWEYAKYVWKCCCFVGVTVIDHAGWVHVTTSNSFVIATREELPTHHPFRRLLDVFTYRTIYINYGVKAALLGKNMLIQRIAGYDYPVLEQVGKAIYDLYEFKPLHERLDPEMSDVPDEVFPINHDSIELYKCMEYLFKEYINVYYENEE
eukprot:32927_1